MEKLYIEGSVFEAARFRAGLTKKELAEKVGVDPSWISQIVHRHRSPSRKLVKRCADVLAVREDYLLVSGDSVER